MYCVDVGAWISIEIPSSLMGFLFGLMGSSVTNRTLGPTEGGGNDSITYLLWLFYITWQRHGSYALYAYALTCLSLPSAPVCPSPTCSTLHLILISKPSVKVVRGNCSVEHIWFFFFLTNAVWLGLPKLACSSNSTHLWWPHECPSLAYFITLI